LKNYPYLIQFPKKGFKNNQKKIMKHFKILLSGFFAVMFAGITHAQDPVKVGGALMYPSKNIIENAMNSKDHTTLVAAVKAAGLVETLEGPGPFTVFAPTNEAFAMLPAGTVDNLLKPENKSMLTSILTYHVVSGKWDAAALMTKIKDGNGTAQLTTVQGGMIWAMMKGDKIMLKDEKGNMATVTIKNVYQSNGVIFVIDKVLMPK
jgi:uncharacterized surface protein with fasciclin (FAS1) repeats